MLSLRLQTSLLLDSLSLHFRWLNFFRHPASSYALVIFLRFFSITHSDYYLFLTVRHLWSSYLSPYCSIGLNVHQMYLDYWNLLCVLRYLVSVLWYNWDFLVLSLIANVLRTCSIQEALHFQSLELSLLSGEVNAAHTCWNCKYSFYQRLYCSFSSLVLAWIHSQRGLRLRTCSMADHWGLAPLFQS